MGGPKIPQSCFGRSEGTLRLKCCLPPRSLLPLDALGGKWNCSFRTSSSLLSVIVCWMCIVHSSCGWTFGIFLSGCVIQQPFLGKLASTLFWLLNYHAFAASRRKKEEKTPDSLHSARDLPQKAPDRPKTGSKQAQDTSRQSKTGLRQAKTGSISKPPVH